MYFNHCYFEIFEESNMMLVFIIIKMLFLEDHKMKQLNLIIFCWK